MKHVINVQTGICRMCGLSNRAILTTACWGKGVSLQTKEQIYAGKLDYFGETIGWKELSDVTVESAAVEDTATQGMDQIRLRIAEAKERYVIKKIEEAHKPIEMDEDAKAFLEMIAAVPMPTKLVKNREIPLTLLQLLLQLKIEKLIEIKDSHYSITEKGESLLGAPVIPEVFIDERELAFMLCIDADDGFDNDEINANQESVDVGNLLLNKGMIQDCGQHAHLTDLGYNHLQKLLAIPVTK